MAMGHGKLSPANGESRSNQLLAEEQGEGVSVPLEEAAEVVADGER